MRLHRLQIEPATTEPNSTIPGVEDAGVPRYGANPHPTADGPVRAQARPACRVGGVLAGLIAITALASFLVRSPHNDASAVSSAGLGAGCGDFVATVASALQTDPGAWILGVVDSGGRLAKTLDQTIHDRLVGARASVLYTQYTLPDLEADLRTLDTLIQRSLSKPCSAPVGTVGSDAPARHSA
jgi:hypothetical protein